MSRDGHRLDDDDFLRHIEPLTDLRRLGPNRADLYETTLAYVDRLPNLTEPSPFNAAGLTDEGVAQLAKRCPLRRLDLSTEVDGLDSSGFNLHVLNGLNTLEVLDLTGVRMNGQPLNGAVAPYLFSGLRNRGCRILY